jgi:hypothetical protein
MFYCAQLQENCTERKINEIRANLAEIAHFLTILQKSRFFSLGARLGSLARAGAGGGGGRIFYRGSS